LLATWYVDDSNFGGPWNGTPGEPFTAIQDGINAAIPGDEVHVAEGMYDENIVMKAGVDVLGASPDTATIRGVPSPNGVVLFDNVVNAKLSAFTVSVAVPAPGSMGVVFRGPSDRTAILERTILSEAPIGVFVEAPARPRIENNTLVGFAGGEEGIQIGVIPTDPLIRNNIITGYAIAGIHRMSAPGPPIPLIVFNDVWDNGTDYLNLPNQTGINGNISADPLFVGPGGFHLQSGSPAIDAGDPGSPLDPDGTTADMGALIYDQSPPTQDITSSFRIDSAHTVPFELFNVLTPGTVDVEVNWTGDSDELSVALTGRRRPDLPDPTTPYAEATGTSPLTISYEVTEEDLERGVAWRLIVKDVDGGADAVGEITISIPFDEQPDAAFQREGIFLKSGGFWPSQELHDAFLDQLAATEAEGLHALISLNGATPCCDAFQLEQLGLFRQSFLPGWNSHGFVDKDIDLNAPVLQARLRYFTPLEPEDKVDPHILLGNYDHFVVLEDRQPTGNYVLNEDETLDLSVLFAADVRLDTIEDILTASAVDFSPMTDSHWDVNLDPENLLGLASYDEVEWISPGAVPRVLGNDNTRGTVHVDDVQDPRTVRPGGDLFLENGYPVYRSLSGKGITVGVYDSGINDSHPDFKNPDSTNKVVNDRDAVSHHGTHVSGVVAGTGFQSDKNDVHGDPNEGAPFEWRGMAPNAELIDLDKNDTDSASEALAAIKEHSMDVSNHSHAFSYDGQYSRDDKVVDQIIRGGALSEGEVVPRRPKVGGAGNDGGAAPNSGNQFGYFSLGKQSKNMIIVGNWDGHKDELNGSSGMGPTYDGRIKPDLVAPGTDVKSTTTSVNEEQEILFKGGMPTTGTFTIEFDDGTSTCMTREIRHRATATVIESQLKSLDNIGPHDVYVTGGPLPRPITVSFMGELGARNVELMKTTERQEFDNNAEVTVETKTKGTTSNGYVEGGGSSTASPVVTGTIALMLQAWNEAYSIPPDTNIVDDSPPLPSTLKAILIQTADDIVADPVKSTSVGEIDSDSDGTDAGGGNDGKGKPTATVGPDFATGWGLVNALAAVNLLQDFRTVDDAPTPNRIIQDTVYQNGIVEYDFVVDEDLVNETDDDNNDVKVTLAWDDVEASLSLEDTDPHLVNDLDLELVAPDGTVFYPWQLGHSILDLNDNVLSDDAQPPGTDIAIYLPLKPHCNPAVGHDYIPLGALTGTGTWVAKKGKDHLNNVEQVFVDNADLQAGHWTLRVLGFDVQAYTAQDYSVVGFPYPDLPDLAGFPEERVAISGLDQDITFTWTARNIGNAPTADPGNPSDPGDFAYQVLLSKDFALGGDVFLPDSNQTRLGPLDVGEEVTHTSTVTISEENVYELLGDDDGEPWEDPLGALLENDVFLLVRIDSGGEVLEHNETNLVAVQIARQVDVVLVMDRSGSMDSSVSTGTQTKLQILQDSANLFLDLMRLDAGDRLGEVSFANSATTIFDDSGGTGVISEITDDNIDDAKDAVKSLSAGGATNIAEGLQEGLGLLTAAGSGEGRRRVIVFFSDGKWTAGYDDPTEPSFLDQFENVNVFSVGFGTEGDTGISGIDVGLLQQLTNVSDGFHHVTPSSLELDKFFVNAVAGAIDSQVIVDPTGVIGPGRTETVDVNVSEQDSIVTFVVTWDDRDGDLELALKTPSGVRIDEENLSSFGKQITLTPTPPDPPGRYKILNVHLPITTGANEDHAGGWEILITNRGSSQLRYSASAIAQSTLRLVMSAPEPSSGGTFTPGGPVPLGAKLSQLGGTSVCAAIATVRPNIPLVSLSNLLASSGITEADLVGIPLTFNGEERSLQERMVLLLQQRFPGGELVPRADGEPFELGPGQDAGEFAGSYSDTQVAGLYSFITSIDGLAANCQGFQREFTHSATVALETDPNQTDVTVNGDPQGDPQGERYLVVTVTPRSAAGDYLGPGRASEIVMSSEELTPDPAGVRDNLDGSYTQTFSIDPAPPDTTTTLNIQAAGVDLPPIRLYAKLPAPQTIEPAVARNDPGQRISVSASSVSEADGIVLRREGQSFLLTRMPPFDSPTVEAEVPSDLAPGLYTVHLHNDTYGTGPGSETCTFRVVGRGQDYPNYVNAMFATHESLLGASTDLEGLSQLGLSLRDLRSTPSGRNLTALARQRAIDELAGLLAGGKGEVRESQIPAFSSALNRAKIDARFVPAGPISTRKGSNVIVELGNGVSATFHDVDVRGDTTLTMREGPREVPRTRRGSPHTTYDINTTASLGGPIDVRIVYEEGDFPVDVDEESLRLFHREAGEWVDRTTDLNTGETWIEARVNDLSKFVIVSGDDVFGAGEIAGRHIFYNNSSFDGNDPGADASDDNAIAPDPSTASEASLGKTALLPGQTAKFQNYTSYGRGITGIMVDIKNLADADGLSDADFEFRVSNRDNRPASNADDPSTWAMAPRPTISLREGAGTDGSERVTLIWDDHAIENQWLQVTVKANATTGLDQNDVFYVGNAVGECGDATAFTFVDGTDFAGARDNPHVFDDAPIDDPFDYDRDSKVTSVDLAIARDNHTNFLTCLTLFTAPPLGGSGSSSHSSSASSPTVQLSEVSPLADHEVGAGVAISGSDWPTHALVDCSYQRPTTRQPADLPQQRTEDFDPQTVFAVLQNLETEGSVVASDSTLRPTGDGWLNAVDDFFEKDESALFTW